MEIGRAFMNVVGDGSAPAIKRGDIPVIDPSDGQEFTTIARGASEDIDAAVLAARCAFETVWRTTPAVQRGRFLTKLSASILEHHAELAELECRDTGKPIQQARADITACARYFEFYGGAADKLHGETIPYAEGFTVFALREPYGVTGHIIPWNYPSQILGRTVGASLAAGNACVVKPAEDACLSVVRIAELALDCGAPARRFQRCNRLRGRGGRGAGCSHRDRSPLVHRISAGRRHHSPVRSRQSHTSSPRTGRQIAADRFRRRRSGPGPSSRRECDCAECGSDLLGGQPGAHRAADL